MNRRLVKYKWRSPTPSFIGNLCVDLRFGLIKFEFTHAHVPSSELAWTGQASEKNVVTLGMRCCNLLGVGLAGGSNRVIGSRSSRCTVVRFYVAKYSASATEMWARSHGATDAEIEAARRCLKMRPARSAQAARWTAE